MPANWTLPRDWTAGELVTASIGNSAWRDNLMYLKDSPVWDGTPTSTGNLTLTASLIGNGTTESTSTLTGAIQTDGGLGVVKALWVGGLANVAGALTVGGNTVISNGSLVSGAAAVVTGTVEAKGVEAAFRLQTHSASVSSEGYMAHFGPLGEKTGVLAFQWVDRGANGFGAVNCHATKWTAGVNADEFGWVYFAKDGFVVFPDDISAAGVVGDRVMKVNGALTTIAPDVARSYLYIYGGGAGAAFIGATGAWITLNGGSSSATHCAVAAGSSRDLFFYLNASQTETMALTAASGLTVSTKAAVNVTADATALTVSPSHASYASSAIFVSTTRAANAAFNMIACNANGVSQFTVDGTGVATAAGGMVLSTNNVKIQGKNVAGVLKDMLWIDNTGAGRIRIGLDADFMPTFPMVASGSINAGNANLDGGFVWDTTNSWLVGYLGGARYKFVGTAY